MSASGLTPSQANLNTRLDDVSVRLAESLVHSADATAAGLRGVAERLAVIDRAQQNMAALASQMTSLQNVLGNKQSRGAFGQWRMESIVQDHLPQGGYDFQATLSNKMRPDCCILMPDNRPLIVDAKFPLESVVAFRDAKTEEERKAAAARAKGDVGKHIADIAEKYLIHGETQDTAFMFVPSEAIYAVLHESFTDLVQRAYRVKVFIVSPTILMLAIQVLQQIRRDARMREAADQIRAEVLKLLDDVGRLGTRVRKLDGHFKSVETDIKDALISLKKIEASGDRIKQVEFAPAPEPAKIELAAAK